MDVAKGHSHLGMSVLLESKNAADFVQLLEVASENGKDGY